MRQRWWRESKTIRNDVKTLARHLVEEHGTPPIPSYAAPGRVLEDAHKDLHEMAKFAEGKGHR